MYLKIKRIVEETVPIEELTPIEIEHLLEKYEYNLSEFPSEILDMNLVTESDTQTLGYTFYDENNEEVFCIEF